MSGLARGVGFKRFRIDSEHHSVLKKDIPSEILRRGMRQKRPSKNTGSGNASYEDCPWQIARSIEKTAYSRRGKSAMNVDKDGILHQPQRKWYSMRETLEIYANGGHVVLTLKEQTPRQKSLAARKENKENPV